MQIERRCTRDTVACLRHTGSTQCCTLHALQSININSWILSSKVAIGVRRPKRQVLLNATSQLAQAIASVIVAHSISASCAIIRRINTILTDAWTVLASALLGIKIGQNWTSTEALTTIKNECSSTLCAIAWCVLALRARAVARLAHTPFKIVPRRTHEAIVCPWPVTV
jgi:hypothetical protein